MCLGRMCVESVYRSQHDQQSGRAAAKTLHMLRAGVSIVGMPVSTADCDASPHVPTDSFLVSGWCGVLDAPTRA